MNTIHCYDRHAPHKLAAVMLGGAALLGLAVGLLLPTTPARQVAQLPRVVIEGKSLSTLAAERAEGLLAEAPSAAGVTVHQLPRVVIHGRRLAGEPEAALDGRSLASNEEGGGAGNAPNERPQAAAY